MNITGTLQGVCRWGLWPGLSLCFTSSCGDWQRRTSKSGGRAGHHCQGDWEREDDRVSDWERKRDGRGGGGRAGEQRAADAQGAPSLSDLQRSKIWHKQPHGGLKSISLDVNLFLHAWWIVLLYCLLGLLEIWEVILRTRVSAHRESLDVRIKKPCGSFWRVREKSIKWIYKSYRCPEEWNLF